jgi:regulator of sigma E protease
MIVAILITFFTLIALAYLHEFGHFILAKRLGVDVEEFGIGYPPRIFGKRMGDTIYSLNLLPFGAFVRIHGEEGEITDTHSFTGRPVWQRAVIALGGVLSFWVIGIILLSVIFTLGAPIAISDTEEAIGANVQIIGVADDSPADTAELQIGDVILELEAGEEKVKIEKVDELQEFVKTYLGKEITLIIKRGNEVFDVTLIPRTSPPEGEGAIGVALTRTIIKHYPFYLAPFKGIETASRLTLTIIRAFGQIITSLFQKRDLPQGVELVGPVGIGSLMFQAFQTGLVYYLHFIAIISLHLAVINLLPVPIVDGGRLLFLGIEKLKGSPIDPKIEQRINAISFALLIGLMIFVTIKDISRIF